MKHAIVAALAILLAGAAQLALATKVAVFGAKPDFLVIAAIVLSLRKSTDAAATNGFFAGLVHGGIANANMTAFVISRLLCGITASAIGRTTVVATPLTVMGASLAATGVASLGYMLLGVPKDLWGWVLSTIGTIVYNAVLVGVAFALFDRPKRRV